MGDGGAMFLGYLMATLGLKLRLENSNHLSAWLAPILILAARAVQRARGDQQLVVEHEAMATAESRP